MLATAFAGAAKPAASEIGHSAPSLSGGGHVFAGEMNVLSHGVGEGQTRVIDAKEHLFCEGDRVSHIYLVEAGHACIYRMMADGRRQVIDFAYPGDIIGLGSLGAHASNAQATVKTRVRCIPVPMLHAAAQRNAGLAIKLYEALSQELLAAREHVFTVTQCTAAERVAAFLLALSRRNARRGEKANELVLPMTRSDIADFLGLTIETVSRVFSKFRADGLIGIEHCILVTIRDAEALAGIAVGD